MSSSSQTPPGQGALSDTPQARARRAARADKSASKPVAEDGRQVLVWPVTLEGGPHKEWLIAAPFRPTKGWWLETGRNPAVLRKILEVAEDAPPLPKGWGGHASVLVSPDRQVSFKVAVKSQEGDKKHQLQAAAAKVSQAASHQGKYEAPSQAPALKTAPTYWGIRTDAPAGTAWKILRSRVSPSAGDRLLGGPRDLVVLEVAGSFGKPPGKPVVVEQYRIKGASPQLQAATITNWEYDKPQLTVGKKVYRGNQPPAEVRYPSLAPEPKVVVAAEPPQAKPKPATPPVATPAPKGKVTFGPALATGAELAPLPPTPLDDESAALSVLATAGAMRSPLATAMGNAASSWITQRGLGLGPWLKRALDATTPELKTTEVQRALQVIEGPIVQLALSPQGREVLDAVERAFPGSRVAMQGAPAGIFQALASGAMFIARQKYKAHAFYRTCASWAEGAHYMDGGWRGAPHPTWAYGRAAALRTQSPGGGTVDGTATPATACDHDPMTCNCLGRDVSDRVLVFGMDESITPAQVAAWCGRWGKVLTLVPNQAFDYFTTTINKALRLISVKGDPQALALPCGYWYGATTWTKVPRWFWQPAKELTWQKQAVGAAFMMVEFGVVTRGQARPPASVFSLFEHALELDEDPEGNLCVGGAPVARRSVVEQSAAALAGRPLTEEAYWMAERTAARAVRESPGELLSWDEARAAAELAWAQVRRTRSRWLGSGWFAEFLWPTPDAHVHGTRRGLGRLHLALGLLALVPVAAGGTMTVRSLAQPRTSYIWTAGREMNPSFAPPPVPMVVLGLGSVVGTASAVLALVPVSGRARRPPLYKALVAAYLGSVAGTLTVIRGWPYAVAATEWFKTALGALWGYMEGRGVTIPGPLRGWADRSVAMSVLGAGRPTVSFVRDVLFAPVVEEWLKHCHPVVGPICLAAIAGFEATYHLAVSRADRVTRVSRAINSMAFHTATTLIPLPGAITLHATWNLWALHSAHEPDAGRF